ncbi:hypothetical protein K456DRAFT_1749544 [Colletotrichum gloeosporioides 23]|nr:hypothetical protein K456DRAFT_1749544 [Colletotrichum gloeosporioides 23]
MPRARLRTKTGCTTCRQRKVKCGEERPCCRNCAASARDCAWPSSDQLHDRRFRGRRLTASEKHASQGPSPPSPTPSCDELSLMSFGHREMPEIEHDLSHHYLNVLVTALLLPTVTEADLEDYGTQVMGMMMSCDSVKYAVLANSASNKFMLTKNCRYHNTALRYYLRAIESVNRSLLDLGSSHESPSDTLLTTVVYLYLYNFWGADTSLDARKHVDGAMSLLKLRYEDKSSPLSMSSTLHRLATESVLYQAFLLAARKPFAPNFHIDPQFMAQSESFLNNELINTLFSDSSLVLGLPLRLYRLITVIIDMLNSPEHPGAETVTRLLQEIKPWEEFVTTDRAETGSAPFSTPSERFQRDAITLFVLAASLLLDYITEYSISTPSTREGGLLGITGGTTSPFLQTTRWQVVRALSILRRPEAYETWTRCYLGAWPMLILGYSVTSQEDIDLVKLVLYQMRDRMGLPHRSA